MKIIKLPFILLYTLYTWFHVCFAVFSHYLLARTFGFLFKDKETGYFKLAQFFISCGFKYIGMPVKVVGLENIPKEKPFILVSNHQSFLDIPLILGYIPKNVAFVAKKELFKIPVLGWQLTNMGHIKMDRQNARAALQQLATLKETIKNNGKSFIFFPEGTRSTDGKILPFKTGAFKLAVETGTTVIPCRIDGTMKALNKKSLLIRHNHLKLTIGKAIDVEKKSAKPEIKSQADKLKNSCSDIINSL
jgi:1-acyl-sn-glycerol-3-phosphate acyltransferase